MFPNEYSFVSLLKIGDNQVCYYNGKSNVTSVKWTYADKTIGFILFVIGYGMAAIVFPFLIFILIVLTFEHRRQRQRQLIFCHLRHISNSSSSLNQMFL